MNHLCGLPNLGGEDDSSLPKNLTNEEREVLTAFRQRYESALYGEGGEQGSSSFGANGDANNEEEKKESSSHHPASNNSAPVHVPKSKPTYEISQDQLPPSGLRPLDNITLYKYLLADRRKDGSFDTEASYQRLIAALKFRKEYQCDAIVTNISSSKVPSSNIQKCQRYRVAIWAGKDYTHRPVVFERLGSFFSSGNATKVSQDEWLHFYLYFLETHFSKMRESSQKEGSAVDRINYFADFQGIVKSILNRKIWKVIPVLKALVNTVECHYPEVVDHIVLFNVPRIASVVYNAIKTFLDPVTVGKIELFAGVPTERFRELMDESVIPVEYGGMNEMEYPQTSLE